jgi:hypothetical protein
MEEKDVDEMIKELKQMMREMEIYFSINWYDWIVQHKYENLMLFHMLDKDVIKLMKDNGKT